MRNLFLSFFLAGWYSIAAQDLMLLDNVQWYMEDGTSLTVEGNLTLQNEALLHMDGLLNIGSNGSGFNPTSANLINNNTSNFGFVPNVIGTTRMYLNDAAITGSNPNGTRLYELTFLGTNNEFNLGQDLIIEQQLNLDGNRNLTLNGNQLTILNGAPGALNIGSGSIDADAPPAMGYGTIRLNTNGNSNILPIRFRNAAGELINLNLITENDGVADFLEIRTYQTGLDNTPFPTSIGFVADVTNVDMNGNGTEDGLDMLDRFLLIESNGKGLAQISLDAVPTEFSGNLTPTSILNAYTWDGSAWNLMPGSFGTLISGLTIGGLSGPQSHVLAFSQLPDIVLPVECTDFTLDVEDLQVEMSWSTAVEIDNKGFWLERSENGIDFESIAWIDGQGNSQQVTNYQFTDRGLTAGKTYYYQLIQVDFDEEQSAACELLVAEFAESEKLEDWMVSPNPATTYAMVQITPAIEADQLRLLSLNGKEIRNINISTNTIRVEREDLPAGAYFIQLRDQAGALIATKKLIFID
ncbi:MAG: T9SS type A sorting domain-containing protein [Bacteroidota bacterium]